MHILVTNDDGPPSNKSSPYLHSLVSALQDQRHLVSVIVPNEQKSWIAKAHFVSQTIKPTFFRPGTLHQDNGVFYNEPLEPGHRGEEWVLVNGTPATCTQLGLYHFFQDRPPVDLVVSGPNYGRNSTALFSLSSGTIGGALEGVVCSKKAIALSYAFYSRDHDPRIIAEASEHSVKLIEYLWSNWHNGADLYSINVPLIAGVSENKTMYTPCLPNKWRSGSSFQEIGEDEQQPDPEQREREIRRGVNGEESRKENIKTKARRFRWAPKFGDVHKTIEDAPPGNDGWALTQGFTSITPLRANFMEAPEVNWGELKLSAALTRSVLPVAATPVFQVFLTYEDEYTLDAIRVALGHFNAGDYALLPHAQQENETSASPSSLPYLQISSYESLPFDSVLRLSNSVYANSYIIRKALTRKHYLASTIASFLAKNPGDVLARHVPVSVLLELDYAEFLDEALLEAYELHEVFAQNENKPPKDRSWWILKPSMSDRGQGIRLFSTEDGLRKIFDEWDDEETEEDNDDENDGRDDDMDEVNNLMAAATMDIDEGEKIDNKLGNSVHGLRTSQLRHFVCQPCIRPLLLSSMNFRKFHIRSYVLAVGCLNVFVYDDMLVLSAPVPYTPPGLSGGEDAITSNIEMMPYLTNTCLQDQKVQASNVRVIDSLQSRRDPLPEGWTETLRGKIRSCTASLFRAAAAQATTFQPLPNAFELFGIDWLVDECGEPWLLEVNAFPDFKQSGIEGKHAVYGVWRETLEIVLGGFFGVSPPDVEKIGERRMIHVLDLDIGKR